LYTLKININWDGGISMILGTWSSSRVVLIIILDADVQVIPICSILVVEEAVARMDLLPSMPISLQISKMKDTRTSARGGASLQLTQLDSLVMTDGLAMRTILVD
jgi:hypothetical protein